MINKKILAAKILKTSPQKIRFADGAVEEIKKAITRSDLRGLIAVKKIFKARTNCHSRARARKIALQKGKGRRRRHGSKKGTRNAISNHKSSWMARIRSQRKFLAELKLRGLLPQEQYKPLYAKSKGGYFRSIRHIKLYLAEHKLIKSKPAGQKPANDRIKKED